MAHICLCQDSADTHHNVPMTNREYKQDGMCSNCAEEVWHELNSIPEYE